MVFGASRDTPAAQKAFKEKYNLNYSLLSDPTGEMAKAFGIKPGARQTVIIDKDGKIERVVTNVAVQTHSKDLLKELNAK